MVSMLIFKLPFNKMFLYTIKDLKVLILYSILFTFNRYLYTFLQTLVLVAIWPLLFVSFLNMRIAVPIMRRGCYRFIHSENVAVLRLNRFQILSKGNNFHHQKIIIFLY